MAVVVVDGLEVVQVHKDQGKASAVTFGSGQFLLNPIMEKRSVGQAGQHVVLCHVAKFVRHVSGEP